MFCIAGLEGKKCVTGLFLDSVGIIQRNMREMKICSIYI